MNNIKILISGDYCPIGRTNDSLVKSDFKGIFNGFEDLTKNVDFSIVNLECPITNSKTKIKKSGPCIKSENIKALEALNFAGFNLLTLANNHILDYSDQGVIDSIEYSKKYNLVTIGAGKNEEEAKKPFIKEIKGKKIGIINIAENEFCSATKNSAGANTLDLISNIKQILELRKNVDKIILIYHGGREHYQLPTPNQRERLRFFIENGVDAIIAHHTHCVSGYEYYLGKPIVYSLGNFIFDYKKKYQKGLWTEGMSVLLNLNNDKIDIELIPHMQGKSNDHSLHLLTGEEKQLFLKRINKLNKIIVNDELFFDEWKKYLKSQESFYLSSLFINNFYVRALFIKNILPFSILKKFNKILLLNLIRCETHNEIIKSLLSKDER